MKAIICAKIGTTHLFTPGHGEWNACECGSTKAKWEDPEAGKIVVAVRGDRTPVRGLGLSNQLLLPALLSQGQAWEDYRHWHDVATEAPGYVFDKSRAGCWAVVFRIGTTSDSRWATVDEHEECFP